MNNFSQTLFAAALFLCGASYAHADPTTRPNVILIISDDQGFLDYGFMGHQQVQTPNLDRMASESLLYTRGYVMPVCSPSLACLLTGRMPHEHGITGNDLSGNRSQRGHREQLAEWLLSNPLMLPKAISEAGYLTFQTGKLWNVAYDDAGFTDGMTDTAGRHGDAGLTIGRKGMAPIFNFIEDVQEQKKPFFIWYAPFMPHEPHNPPEAILDKFRGKGPTKAADKYFAMVDWFDQTCGELDQYLTENGLRDNTVILYLADNGWDAKYGTAKGRSKLSPYATWNSHATVCPLAWERGAAPGRNHACATSSTFAPTILDITGAQAGIDLPGLVLTDRDADASTQERFCRSLQP